MQEKIWQELIKLSKKAEQKKEIPVAAIIVKNNKVIAKAYNRRQKNKDVLGHAEILVIRKAEKKLKDWRLNDCFLYVTLKPCELCEKIIIHSRIKEVFYLVEPLLFKKEYQKTTFKKTETNVCQEYKKILQNSLKKRRKSRVNML